MVGVNGTVVLSWVTYEMVRALLWSPLAKVPGPFANRLSSVPHILHTIKGDRIQWVEKLHRKYGEEVVLEPAMVISRRSAAVKTIYGNTALQKSAFYDGLGFSGLHKHVLQARDNKVAIRTRKHILTIMTKDNLFGLEPIFHRYLAKFKKGVDSNNDDGKVDLMLWLRLLAMDIILEASFGKDFGQLDLGGLSDLTQAIFDAIRFNVIRALIPGFQTAATYLPIPVLNRMASSEARFLNLGTSGLETFKSADNISHIMAPQALRPLFGEDEESLVKELAAFAIAGSDTTSTTLLYLFYELALHPTLQEALYEEVAREISAEHYDTISRADVEKLPLLNAFIKETLRVHPPVPGFLPRDVPATGIVLGGKFIPPGTVVSSSVHQTLRNPDVYHPDPDSFRPQRWLEDVTEDMQRSFIPFSSGLRTCVGMNFAWSEIYVISASILCTYQFKLPEETTLASMEMVEGFFTLPKSGQCVLQLVKRSSNK
ncbi:hypothetical protein EX895_003627 [Sporisorium graminicola]|uniref:Cytochrome P450 n=1 Tax=Sporisorium graminicola TaxID=280036 RepID=A0A4U7KR97_9BASI|nr:hypothetical protein EX895_003627 [Sporisorium graminicola]TKY86950.1 hypothetical protein EX895_003627 [Sporisorium graminicola]